MENKILVNFVKRLGQDLNVLKKAEEFLRVLQNKVILNTNDVAKIVMCIDLAARIIGAPFDKANAIKLSGLRKVKYENLLNTAEKILDLGRILTVPEMCVQLGCTEAKETAELILSKYKAHGIVADFNHPQYVAAAVYTACKLQRIKMSKQQFITLSHLKSKQWKMLEEEFCKFAENNGFDVWKSNKTKKCINFIDNLAVTKENEQQVCKKLADRENQIEDYEVWKKRILEEAQAALIS